MTLRGGEVVESLVAGPRRRGRRRPAVGRRSPAGVGRGAARRGRGGRRGPASPAPRWLAELGVRIGEEEHDTGIVYLTRWYRTADGWDPVIDGEELVQLAGDLGYLFYLAVPADRGAFSLTMAIGADDDACALSCCNPAAFDRAARALPLPAGWWTGRSRTARSTRWGRWSTGSAGFTDETASPLVLGLHAVGDAHTCTNPIYGRGCSLALVQAVALTDAMAAHPADPVARARRTRRPAGS